MKKHPRNQKNPKNLQRMIQEIQEQVAYVYATMEDMCERIHWTGQMQIALMKKQEALESFLIPQEDEYEHENAFCQETFEQLAHQTPSEPNFQEASVLFEEAIEHLSHLRKGQQQRMTEGFKMIDELLKREPGDNQESITVFVPQEYVLH